MFYVIYDVVISNKYFMQFSIQKELLDKFPDLKIGLLFIQGIDNAKAVSQVKEKFQMVQEDLQKKYKAADLDNIAEIKFWKKSLQKANIDFEKFPVSIYAMTKRVLKDNKWIKSLNTLVDIYNTVSLQNMIPMGAYDIDRTGDNLELRFATHNDKFLALGKTEYENCNDDEIIFADENEVLCRNWVWKQSENQKMEKRTQNVIMRIEGSSKTTEQLQDILEELSRLIEANLGGKISSYIVDKNTPTVNLPEHNREEFTKKSNLVNEILNRGVSEINVREDLEAELWSAKKLRIKLGIDPTGFDLTLGHAVVLRKLKHFQDAGHQIVFLIGNFTAQIGDPTGKSQTRDVLDKQQVMKNAETYLRQAAKVLDVSKFEIRYNADWLENMSFSDVLKLASNFTVAQMLERDMFQDRIKAAKEINLVEFMYPLMQGYDSVPLEADVEIGGTDQLFNMMCARPIQKSLNFKAQNVLTVQILVGLDGKEKMSKSLGNYIAIMDCPKEMYGKTMSIPDEIIINYFELATDVPMEEVRAIEQQLKNEKINPRDLKARLAFEITKLYHGEKEASKAQEEFKEIFQQGGLPKEIGECSVVSGRCLVVELLIQSGFCGSKGEAKRSIEGGGVRIDGAKIEDVNFEITLKKGKKKLLQLGKRKFVYLVTASKNLFKE